MKPLYLELCAWGPYKDKQSIDFEKIGKKGFFLITGVTGAGKTTIFDAIIFALFGEFIDELRDMENIRSGFANKEKKTYVTFLFSHKDKIVKVHRKLSGTKEEATLNINGIEDEVEGINLVTTKIIEIIGIDFKHFKQITMLSQSEFRKFLLANPKDKIRTFKEIFNIELFDSILTLLIDKEKLLTKKSEEYLLIKNLENVICGINNKELTLEQYIFTLYLDNIILNSNLRLQVMSEGRYEIVRIKDSLDIEVMDHYIGKPRSVKSLSSGESFKAAFAMALGFSDTIKLFTGATEMDTLFIDDGFGILDNESLDQAIDALITMNNNQLIGIISHVEELKERIEIQITIEKTNSGSRIKQ